MDFNLDLQIPESYSGLFEKWRFKVYYGGRGGGKSWAVVDTLLWLGMQKSIRILCARELQNSIADSVHRLLSDRISEHNLDGFYKITQKSIEGLNGTIFLFKGLKHNYREIKSTEGIDICWCFPAGTLVDGRPIETLREGDLVQSFNHATGKIELKPVVRAIKNTCPAILIKISTLHGGTPILCTSEHPVFIKNKGYVPASEIKSGDIVYEKVESSSISTVLRRMWGNNRNKFQRSPRCIYKEGRDLLYGLFKALIDRKSQKAQPNARPCLSVKNFGSAEKFAQERGCGQWSWHDKGTKRIIGKAWARMVAGTCCSNKRESSGIDELQSRFSKRILYALYRMRWAWTRWGDSKGRGRKKKYVLAERGVDSVEIQEQANIGFDGRSDGGDYVYNIEVKGNNNYFAEGVLVHNCEEAENISSRSWEVLIPTIRKGDSEIWVTFNTKNVTDATYKRFIINKPSNALVRKVSWRDNPFFPDVLNLERLHMMKLDKAAYDHIWEGEPDTRFSGAVYAVQMDRLHTAGHLSEKVQHDPDYPVYTLWDLGFGDTCVIWFYQVAPGEILMIDYYENNGEGIGHYCDLLKGKIEGEERFGKYRYEGHYVPQDAKKKLMEANGKSIIEQAWHDHGVRMVVIAETTHANRNAALRALLPKLWFNSVRCAPGIDALMAYHYEYNEDLQRFGKDPHHDWSSHASTSLELLPSSHGKAVTVKQVEHKRAVMDFFKRRRGHGMDQGDPYRVKPVRKK